MEFYASLEEMLAHKRGKAEAIEPVIYEPSEEVLEESEEEAEEESEEAEDVLQAE